jgi:hypothetical protein
MKPFVESKILENLPLRDGSEAYKGWKDPPVTPVVSYRFFNLTNQEAFLKGDDNSFAGSAKTHLVNRCVSPR